MSARRTTEREGAATAQRPLAWPGDPEGVTAAAVDFEALAHVLANTCRFGGRTRRYHSLAGHALVLSEEVDALDGLEEEDRRRLALHALLVDAPSAWLRGAGAESQRAAERSQRLAAGIGRAVREAAGLDGAPGEEQAELLRLLSRMTAAAERRDLFGAGGAEAGAAAFPPLKRRIRPVGPGRAARLWLARFHALYRPPGGAGAETAGGPSETGNDGESGDVAHSPQAQGPEQRAPRRGGKDARRAA